MNYAEQIRSVKDYIRLPLVYNHWYIAGLAEEFEQKPKTKTLLERSIVFFRTADGEPIAFQNRCLHRSFPLSEGFLEGNNLVCRYHGIRYAPDGTIARIPCQDRTADRRLHKYPLREMGPFVFIWMGDPESPDESKLPDLPFLSDPGYRTICSDQHYQGSYLLMQENLNDLTHFAYLHKDTFAFGDFFFDLPTEIKEIDGGIWCNRVDTNAERSIGILPPDIQQRVRGKPIERADGGMSISPGVFKGYAPIHVGDPDSDDRETFRQHIVHYLTPETKTSTHYWWSMSSDFALDNDQYFTGLQMHLSKGFEEDRWACNHMQTLLDDDNFEYREMIIAGDKAGMHFRRVMLNWVTDEYGNSEETK